jgi:serine/threonine protein kinase
VEALDRLRTRDAVAASLSSMSSSAIYSLLHDGGRQEVSIGGATRVIEVAGSPVFVKMIKLSDREVEAGPADTRNLFGLPPWYQYGVGEGSVGFSAWREIACHEMASEWVVTGKHGAFPVLYHWRIVPGVALFGPAEAEVLRAVEFWADTPEIELRLRALSASTTVVAAFLEYVPSTLRGWLSHQLTGTGQEDEVVAAVDRQLLSAAEQMRAEGVLHFDAHHDNVLTTGQHLVVSDFGLASSINFDLDDSEQHFLNQHADHDVAYCATELTNAILGSAMTFPNAKARNDWIQQCARTGATDGVPDPFAATVLRLAPTAALINDFYWQLHNANFQTPFPASEVAAALRIANR